MYLVQGLEDNRFALISKTHHALVDGISGVDLATVLFDANPVPVGLTPPVRPWEPKPEPSELALLARGVEGVAKVPLRLGAALLGRPASAPGDRAGEGAAEGARRDRLGLLNPAPTCRSTRRSGRTGATAGCTRISTTSRS